MTKLRARPSTRNSEFERSYNPKPELGRLGGLFDPEQVKDKAVQGHFGVLDSLEGFSDAATAKKLEEVLRRAGNAQAEVFLYEAVGHAFMNDSPAPYESFEARIAAQGPGFPAYDEKAASLAWERVLGFFSSHLGAEK